jgi:hypothetical protein
MRPLVLTMLSGIVLPNTRSSKLRTRGRACAVGEASLAIEETM